MTSEIETLRLAYHRRIFGDVLRLNAKGEPNNTDSGSPKSGEISKAVIAQIGAQIGATVLRQKLNVQTVGKNFELATMEFLQSAFAMLGHLRPGEWIFACGGDIRNFEQYAHLSAVMRAVEKNRDLAVIFGDYLVKPDIVVCRRPVEDDEINKNRALLSGEKNATHTPLRRANSESPILHASVSCKWTLRSDRAQNARTEGLNLARNRKGKTPHIVVVVAEPLPGRITPLAYGTGDLDCVYHFALRELVAAAAKHKTHSETLETLIAGKRLRDISDLPFDLAI